MALVPIMTIIVAIVVGVFLAFVVWIADLIDMDRFVAGIFEFIAKLLAIIVAFVVVSAFLLLFSHILAVCALTVSTATSN